MNMTIMAPETEKWTNTTWRTVGNWAPQPWSPQDAHVDSFQKFWMIWKLHIVAFPNHPELFENGAMLLELWLVENCKLLKFIRQ